MSILQRVHFGAGLLALLVLAAWGCLRALPPPAWGFGNPFAILEQVRCDEERAHDLDVRLEVFRQHYERKRTLAREVLQGRRSLGEATRLLREEGAAPPWLLRCVRHRFPGISEDDALGLHLLEMATHFREDDPVRDAAIVRLQAQLAAAIVGKIPVPLP